MVTRDTAEEWEKQLKVQVVLEGGVRRPLLSEIYIYRAMRAKKCNSSFQNLSKSWLNVSAWGYFLFVGATFLQIQHIGYYVFLPPWGAFSDSSHKEYHLIPHINKHPSLIDLVAVVVVNCSTDVSMRSVCLIDSSSCSGLWVSERPSGLMHSLRLELSPGWRL